MEEYYPEELREYEEIFGKDIWLKEAKEYNKAINTIITSSQGE